VWSVAYLLAEQLNLFGFGDVQLTELGLQVAVVLQLKQGLGDGLLKLVRLRVALLDDFGLRGDRHLHRHKSACYYKNISSDRIGRSTVRKRKHSGQDCGALTEMIELRTLVEISEC